MILWKFKRIKGGATMVTVKMKDTVKEILTNNIESRGDDFILIAEVYDKLKPEIRGYALDYVLRHHKEYKLPSFSSIVRARRKLQEIYPELEPTKKIKDIRSAEEREYRAFARE